MHDVSLMKTSMPGAADPGKDDQSVTDALMRVSSSGYRLLFHRIELLSEEIKSQVSSGIYIGIGGISFLFGWFFVVQGVIAWLSRFFPIHYAQIGVGFVHVAIGIAFMMICMGRVKSLEQGEP